MLASIKIDTIENDQCIHITYTSDIYCRFPNTTTDQMIQCQNVRMLNIFGMIYKMFGIVN